MKVVVALLVLVAAVSAAPPRNVVPNLLDVLASGRPSNRITNGEVSKVGQFKYQVGLMLHFGLNWGWCGGIIIDESWILTGAQCTDRVDRIDVYLGYTDLDDPSEPNQEIVQVEKENFFIHPEWDAVGHANDISLIKLPAGIKFNEHLQKADLPKKGDTETYANKLAIASGWGTVSEAPPYEEGYEMSDVLRFVEVPVMSNSDCNFWYYGTIDESQICIKTGSERKSFCNGDYGGPLVLSGTNTVIGTTSFNIGWGCEKGYPGVSTRVSHYLDWIKEVSGVTNN